MTSKIYYDPIQLTYGYISDDTSDYFTWVSVSKNCWNAHTAANYGKDLQKKRTLIKVKT